MYQFLRLFFYTRRTVSDSTINIDFTVQSSTLLLRNISAQFMKILLLLLFLACGIEPPISSNAKELAMTNARKFVLLSE